ncbi:MAG: glycosyltransferase family 4 protein [Planctomycetes bacterium]|nr:glycosyltransferase family 4 protein [Planctomycetota bacterium]
MHIVRKHIALIIEHLDARRGGAETWVSQFASFLRNENYKVTIVTQDTHGEPDGCDVRLVRGRGLTSAGRTLDFARRVQAALDELQPHASLATGKALGMHVYQPHGGTVRASQRQNIALMPSYDRRAIKKLLNRLSLKHQAALQLETEQFADPHVRLVAISEMVRRDMKTFYRVDDSRITLVYNGVDTARFDPERLRPLRGQLRNQHQVPDDTVVFLFMGHNFKLKGLKELLFAVRLLKQQTQRPFRLLVVGKNRRWKTFDRLARRLGIDDCVTFVGPCKDAAVAYAAADVFVHPTWYDPCSLVMLEAMACGLPSISTRFNGASELAEGSGAAVVLDAPRPVAPLTEAMLALMDGERREAMGRAAREVALQHPMERNFREMLACLVPTAAAGASCDEGGTTA